MFKLGIQASTTECPELTDPENGLVSVTTRNVGDQAVFTCNNLHTLEGSITLTCRDSGQWDQTPPQRCLPCTFNHHFVIMLTHLNSNFAFQTGV